MKLHFARKWREILISRRTALTIAALAAAGLAAAPQARAELAKNWRDATAEEKGAVPPSMSNLFMAFDEKQGMTVMAGILKVEAAEIDTPEKRTKFVDDILEGVATTGMVLKDKETKTINGQPFLECVYEIPKAGKYSLLGFALGKDQMLNMSVVSPKPLAWDDPLVVALVKELPIK